MAQTVINSFKDKMDKSVQAYSKELATLRTGRANASMLDKISIEYYGAPTPLNQMAGITTPEPRMLVIQPYDKSIIKDIEKAITSSDLGLNPTNDGNVIRIEVPALTEERRRDLVKLVKKYAEDAKVAIRNIRRDANDALKKMEKSKEITEDALKGHSDEVQKLTDGFIKKIDEIAVQKEKDVMAV